MFSAAQITQIFTSAQDLDASLTAEQFSQHDVEMTFAEFNEAIACMSVWRDPNPYARVFCQAYCALSTFVQSILIVSHSQYSHVLIISPSSYTRLSAKVVNFLTRELYPPLNLRIKRLPSLIPQS